jgi:hypothetical protein
LVSDFSKLLAKAIPPVLRGFWLPEVEDVDSEAVIAGEVLFFADNTEGLIGDIVG